MHPKAALHKKNGRTRRPPVPADGPEIMRLVHSVRDHTPSGAGDVQRFDHLVRSERPASLLALAAREVESLKSAIARALASAESGRDDGPSPDTRRMLEGLRDEADSVARLLGRFTAAAEPDSGGRRVLSLEDVIDRALEGLPASVVVTRATPRDLPKVAGHARQLTRMIGGLLAGGIGPGTVTVETSAREAALRGEWIVRVCIIDRRSAVDADAADIHAAAAIACDHGGFLSTERVDDEGRAFTIDLPAL